MYLVPPLAADLLAELQLGLCQVSCQFVEPEAKIVNILLSELDLEPLGLSYWLGKLEG